MWSDRVRGWWRAGPAACVGPRLTGAARVRRCTSARSGRRLSWRGRRTARTWPRCTGRARPSGAARPSAACSASRTRACAPPPPPPLRRAGGARALSWGRATAPRRCPDADVRVPRGAAVSGGRRADTRRRQPRTARLGHDSCPRAPARPPRAAARRTVIDAAARGAAGAPDPVQPGGDVPGDVQPGGAGQPAREGRPGAQPVRLAHRAQAAQLRRQRRGLRGRRGGRAGRRAQVARLPVGRRLRRQARARRAPARRRRSASVGRRRGGPTAPGTCIHCSPRQRHTRAACHAAMRVRHAGGVPQWTSAGGWMGPRAQVPARVPGRAAAQAGAARRGGGRR